MAENKLQLYMDGLNQCLQAIKTLEIQRRMGKRSAPHKIVEFTLQRDKYIARLVTFGQKYPIVRVTILNTTTNEYEYAFFTDITVHDAELLINTKCEVQGAKHKFIIAEYIKLGWEILVK